MSEVISDDCDISQKLNLSLSPIILYNANCYHLNSVFQFDCFMGFWGFGGCLQYLHFFT